MHSNLVPHFSLFPLGHLFIFSFALVLLLESRRIIKEEGAGQPFVLRPGASCCRCRAHPSTFRQAQMTPLWNSAFDANSIYTLLLPECWMTLCSSSDKPERNLLLLKCASLPNIQAAKSLNF